VAALPIIKHFEVFKDLLPGFLPCAVLAMMNEFPFQRAEETLHAGIIPAVASARHASDDSRRGQALLVGRGCILTALVGMVEQPPFRMTPMKRHS